MPISGVSPLSYQMTNKTSTASASALDDAWAWLSGRGQEVMAGVYTGETIGLTACGLLGEAWAPEFDAGIDSDADTDTDIDSDTDTDIDTDTDTDTDCTPVSYFDTDFLTGTVSNTEVDTGAVSLIADTSVWTCYDGTVFPETVGWTENAPGGWSTKVIDSGTALHISSMDLDNVLRYEYDPSFAGDYMVEARMHLINSQGGNSCAIDIRNGSYAIDFRIQNGQIIENITGAGYGGMTPTLGYYTYKIIQQGLSFSVFVDDVLRISDTAVADGTPSRLWFHDIGGLNDSEAYWDYLCWYNGGSSLPYVASGTYTSAIVDTGNHLSNDIGTGAMLHWSQNTPAGTTIEMEFCASNDAGLSGATCASGLIANTGEVIPGSVAGRYFRWIASLSTTDPVQAPELFDVTLNYETCD